MNANKTLNDMIKQAEVLYNRTLKRQTEEDYNEFLSVKDRLMQFVSDNPISFELKMYIIMGLVEQDVILSKLDYV